MHSITFVVCVDWPINDDVKVLSKGEQLVYKATQILYEKHIKVLANRSSALEV